jgi:methyl-accepting chemotaxis protein
LPALYGKENKMKWSINKKMIAMGLGMVMVLSVLATMNYQSYRSVNTAMGSNSESVRQQNIAREMKVSQIELALAATESIVEKDQGKITAERMAKINASFDYLTKHVKDLNKRADSDQEKESMKIITQGLGDLKQVILKDLVALIEASAVRVREINQAFKNMHSGLKTHADNIEAELSTLGATLQFKINMSDTDEEAEKAREGNEQVNYVSKAVANLLLAAVESIIEKDSGKITEKRLRTINRNISFLEKNLPGLNQYTSEAEENENVQNSQKAVNSLIQLIRQDLPMLIENSATEMDQIKTSFKNVDTTLKEHIGNVSLHLNRVAEASSKKAQTANNTLQKTQSSTFKTGIIVVMIAVMVMIVVFFFFARGITKPINTIISGLNGSSDLVATSSSHISGASQALAEGSSEQAASIEETSSSLEEMSAMTKQNAQNAGHANTLMKGTNEVVGKANETMLELTDSMEEISKASTETSKIVKTIDEIAFQTNLLALNAAVEAARAGEAGAGFAVVADEVRNLAMRAADAARNTAGMIESTVNKVNQGAEFVTLTNEAFSEVSGSSAKVGELVAEIAAASNEQAQGIDQVNKAVAEMDKVVQQNAATAEESASASEEMSNQAEQMKTMVDDLVTMINGHKKGYTKGTSAPKQAAKTGKLKWISQYVKRQDQEGT